MNTNKLYVGGLPYSTTEANLEDLFAEHGTVDSARIITDRTTGRSKGFGFVEMGNQAEAEAAAAQLNNSQLEGRTLVVNEAKPRENRGSFGGGGQSRNRW